ncbi:unnamed protein product [Heligmosomoides polygyrus]|uniref:Zpr1 domain-containing protein n=1 Tax=Heligmosomoides polygyrus TaxID=6339 RepID=A0A183FD04_HELPZ|nr:unnamed protein product [Heligmosomoides polygyrus]
MTSVGAIFPAPLDIEPDVQGMSDAVSSQYGRFQDPCTIRHRPNPNPSTLGCQLRCTWQNYAQPSVKDRQQVFLTLVCNSCSPEVDNEAYANYMEDMKLEETLLSTEAVITTLRTRLEEVASLTKNQPGSGLDDVSTEQPPYNGDDTREPQYPHRTSKDFRTVLPILDLVKGKFPLEIQQKLHDLEFQAGTDFDLFQVMHHLDNIIVSREKYEDSTTLCHRDSNADVSGVVTHAITVPIQSADDVEETTTKCYARIDHTEANLLRIEIALGRARSEPAATIGTAPRGIATHRGAHFKIEPRTTTATIVAQLETGDVHPVALSRNM